MQRDAARHMTRSLHITNDPRIERLARAFEALPRKLHRRRFFSSCSYDAVKPQLGGQVVPPPDGLLTLAEVARRLRCSEKTLRAHLDAGDLRYVIIGKGTKRPRKMIAPADLDDFIANQTRKDSPVCRYIASRARRSSTSNSASEVIAFTGQPRPRPGAKPKKSRRASARRRNSA